MATKRGWTKEEEDFLVKSYRDINMTVSQIAEALGKSQNTIIKKAANLGVKKIRFSDIPVPEGHRICRKCKQIKPSKDFYVNRSKANDPYDSNCKICSSLLAQERRNKKILEQIQKEVEKAENNDKK